MRQKENYKAEVMLGYKERGRYLRLQNERMKEKRKRKKPSEPGVWYLKLCVVGSHALRCSSFGLSPSLGSITVPGGPIISNMLASSL